ncbi:MAG: hypothetical protein K2V38_19855 [Gemmataceae bacterium]|nr:hypothetical protein [Gemmataceae bacterium]
MLALDRYDLVGRFFGLGLLVGEGGEGFGLGLGRLLGGQAGGFVGRDGDGLRLRDDDLVASLLAGCRLAGQLVLEPVREVAVRAVERNRHVPVPALSG